MLRCVMRDGVGATQMRVTVTVGVRVRVSVRVAVMAVVVVVMVVAVLALIDGRVAGRCRGDLTLREHRMEMGGNGGIRRTKLIIGGGSSMTVRVGCVYKYSNWYLQWCHKYAR